MGKSQSGESEAVFPFPLWSSNNLAVQRSPAEILTIEGGSGAVGPPYTPSGGELMSQFLHNCTALAPRPLILQSLSDVFVWILVAVSNSYNMNVILLFSSEVMVCGGLILTSSYLSLWCWHGSSLGGPLCAWEKVPTLDTHSPTVQWEVASVLVWSGRNWNNIRNNKRISVGLRAWKPLIFPGKEPARQAGYLELWQAILSYIDLRTIVRMQLL